MNVVMKIQEYYSQNSKGEQVKIVTVKSKYERLK